MRAAAATSSTTGIDPAGALASAPVRSSPTRTIALLAVVCTLVAMMQSLIAPLLTVLPPQLNTTAAAFTWAVTAALLAGAVSTPIAGRLGDMLGKKTVLVGLLVPLVVGCAISALATNLPVMLLGRTLQGVALGSIPVSIALLQEVVPPHRRATAIALASASMGIGGGIALPLSAGFAQFFSWRALFWILVGLGLVLAILIAILVPAGARPAPGQRFDAVGALLLAVGLSSFLIALSQGSVWGWTSWAVLGAFGLSAVALLAWATWEFRAAQPLVDLRAATTPVALLTNLASIFTGMAMYITLVATPQILPGGIIQMLLAPVGGRLINARGPKVALLAGIAIIACGYGTMQVALASALGLMVGHMIIKGGIGIAYGAMPALIMSSVSAADIGSATSFNTLMRQIGSSTGSAVVGAVLAAVAVTAGGDVLLTEAGFRISFLIGLGVALAALTIAAFIPYRRAVTSGTTAA
jgi:MFS family permease